MAVGDDRPPMVDSAKPGGRLAAVAGAAGTASVAAATTTTAAACVRRLRIAAVHTNRRVSIAVPVTDRRDVGGIAVDEDPQYQNPQTREWQAEVIRTITDWLSSGS